MLFHLIYCHGTKSSTCNTQHSVPSLGPHISCCFCQTPPSLTLITPLDDLCPLDSLVELPACLIVCTSPYLQQDKNPAPEVKTSASDAHWADDRRRALQHPDITPSPVLLTHGTRVRCGKGSLASWQHRGRS